MLATFPRRLTIEPVGAPLSVPILYPSHEILPRAFVSEQISSRLLPFPRSRGFVIARHHKTHLSYVDFTSAENARKPSIKHYANPIAEREHFFEFRRDIKDCPAAIPEREHLFDDEPRCPRIEAPRWLKRDQDEWSPPYLARHNNFLLIAARQCLDQDIRTPANNSKLGDSCVRFPAKCAAIQPHTASQWRAIKIPQSEIILNRHARYETRC